MSKSSAHIIAVYYSRLAELLQEVEREADALPICVHIERLAPEASGWRAWGVLVTALTGTTIHAAWSSVGKSSVTMLTPYRQQALERAQQDLHDRLVAYARQRGLVVRPGAYEVSTAVFRQSAELPADLPAILEGEQ